MTATKPLSSSASASASASASSSSSCSSESGTDWSSLPRDLLYIILNKLLLLSDMIMFSSVCTNWHSVAKDALQKFKLCPNMYFNRNFPLLLLPCTENNDFIRSLYSINKSEVYDLQLRVPSNKRIFGSSHGWLITLDEDSFEVILINPFYFSSISNGIIRIPQFSAASEMQKEHGNYGFNSEYFICKAVLSSDPVSCPNNFVLMVIYGEMKMLAYWKPGAENWTYIAWSLPMFLDIIYVEDRFLAVNTLGQVYSCKLDDEAYPPYNLQMVSAPQFGLLGTFCRRYIVELPNKVVLQVIRMLKTSRMCALTSPIFTIGFFIFENKVDEDGESLWILVTNLNDGALFLGDNHSLYVTASKYPGCRANSIYFTDDYHDTDAMLLNPYQFTGPLDIGMYRLDDKTVERLDIPLLEKYHMPPPVWILPTV
ncbi:F-box protein At2g26160-like [Chenopodium quinoa]|nr:F-box protein At2g26160-like [Chenopodium quinoa]